MAYPQYLTGTRLLRTTKAIRETSQKGCVRAGGSRGGDLNDILLHHHTGRLVYFLAAPFYYAGHPNLCSLRLPTLEIMEGGEGYNLFAGFRTVMTRSNEVERLFERRRDLLAINFWRNYKY